MIREVDDEPIADVDADQRSWNAAVVRPCVRRDARRDFDVRDPRVEIDFENVRIGIEIDGFRKLEVFVPAGRLQACAREQRGECYCEHLLKDTLSGVTETRHMDEFYVTCPYCGEQVEIYIEPDVRGSFVQDCEVCCNPWRIRVTGRDDERDVVVTRADGSE